MKLVHFILIISIMAEAYGNPIITVAFNGCNFMYSNQNNQFVWRYCYDKQSRLQANWLICTAACCQTKLTNATEPTYDLLQKCMIITEDKTISFTIIILVLGIVFLFFVLLIIIVSAFKIMRYIQVGTVVQQSLDSMPIQWSQQEQNLTMSLQVQKWMKSKNGEIYTVLGQEICSICLDTHLQAELYCGHYYHLQCIISWLKKSRFCPLCHLQNIRSLKVYCSQCKSNYYLSKITFLTQNMGQLDDKCRSCRQEGSASVINVNSYAPQQIELVQEIQLGEQSLEFMDNDLLFIEENC